MVSFTAAVSAEASAMNVRRIQSRRVIAIAVIGSGRRAALMLQRCLSRPVRLALPGS